MTTKEKEINADVDTFVDAIEWLEKYCEQNRIKINLKNKRGIQLNLLDLTAMLLDFRDNFRVLGEKKEV